MKSLLRTPKGEILACVFLASLIVLPTTAHAQTDNYPTRTIRIIVGFSAGGFTDVLGRVIAQKLNERLGQPVIVENKPGAAGTIGADIIAKSKPDGYNLLMGHVNSNSIAPAMYPKLPYDVIKDFTPIVRVASTPLLLTIHPSVPANDVKSFIALAKKKDSNLRFASSGNGSAQHLAAEQFMLMTQTKMLHVPYKGSGQAIVDLLSGQVELNFDSPPNTLQHIRSGKLKALGITSTRRSELVPDVPTIAEAGVPGYEMGQWFAVFGPAGLPKPITDRLNKEINALLKSPDVTEKINSQGGEIIGGSAEEFAAFLKTDTVRWAKLIKDADIKPE
jgi:tripartite-type tricarboxylate transporter receptor subunit TctC